MLKNLFTCRVVDEHRKQKEVPQWSKGNFQYNWIGIYIITIPIIVTLIGILLRVPMTLPIFLWMGYWGIANGMVGVTVGYHRLFSHRSYTAATSMQWFGACFGAGAFQGSIKWWARNHRIHHRYVDTPRDPYDATRGFFFTHFGWFVMRMNYDLLGDVDMSDLNHNRVVELQRRYFGVLAALFGIILPVLTAGLTTGDWWGAFFYATFLKITLVHQLTFFINSLAHTSWLGARQTYSDLHTPHDNIYFAIVTFGEGYHNFHHEFPQDYRNGYMWYHLDPTKWYIRVCEFLGFCHDLHRTPDAVIERCHYNLERKKRLKELAAVEAKLSALEVPVSAVMTWQDMQEQVAEGRKLLVIDNHVLDLEKPIHLNASTTHAACAVNWLKNHPGGERLLLQHVGKDATKAFNGGVYTHSEGARNLVPHLRIAHLKA